jgi:predicted SprT family Zn-dependent metalloprotease
MPDAGWTRMAAEAAAALGMGGLARDLHVEWNPRLRTTAGRAWPQRARIELNPAIRPFGEEEIRRTLLHELAHLVAHARHPRRRLAPHGPEWRRACAELGIPGEPARHELPLARRRHRRRYLYRCPACGLRIRRARPLRQPAACLACCREHAGGRYDRRFELVAEPANDPG